MIVLTLLGEKGGIGKTTLSSEAAAGLANRGRRVLLADADPQAHACRIMGMPEEAGLYDLMVRNARWNDVLRRVPEEVYRVAGGKGELFLLPSNIETRTIALQINDAFKLDTRLRQLEGHFDTVIFDTPPTPSLLHSSILFATDGVVYPTKAEYLALDGLIKSMAHVAELNKQRGNVVELGIQPTQVRSNTLEHQDLLAQIQQRYGGLVWPAIHERTIVKEASRAQRPVFVYAPGEKAATESLAMIDRLENEIQELESVA